MTETSPVVACNTESDYQWENQFPLIKVAREFIPQDHSIKYAIVSRYHAGIYLALKGCPFIIIGNDPKLKGLSIQTKQPCMRPLLQTIIPNIIVTMNAYTP